MNRKQNNPNDDFQNNFQEYFKLGVSNDFILIRDDFPIENISPADFSRLCREMFRRNDEALHGK